MNAQLLQLINKKIDDMNAKALQEELNGRKDTIFHKYLNVFRRCKTYLEMIPAEKHLIYTLEIELKMAKIRNIVTIDSINNAAIQKIMN